jgi:hypothetical protein
MWTYTCAEREILYNTYQEMAIWKSIVTLIYRELLALGRKIDIFEKSIGQCFPVIRNKH